jgi:hypothetical protein
LTIFALILIITDISQRILPLIICGRRSEAFQRKKKLFSYNLSLEQAKYVHVSLPWFSAVINILLNQVPLDGFQALHGARGPQQFNVHKAYGTHLLPSAHTCFNQLDLPDYATEEELREKLLIAIREGSEGFGFA